MAYGDSQRSGHHDSSIEKSLASLKQLHDRTHETFMNEALSAWGPVASTTHSMTLHPIPETSSFETSNKQHLNEQHSDKQHSDRQHSVRQHSDKQHLDEQHSVTQHSVKQHSDSQHADKHRANPEHVASEHHYGHKQHRVPANEFILNMCSSHLNQKLGSPPPWIQPDYRNPPPNLQCASTASNIFRMVLKETHCIDASDNKSYRWLDQVSVQKFMRVMEESGLAKRIPRSQVQPGDCVVGEFDLHRKPGNDYRHVGFVGHSLGHGGHDMVAYSNAGGTFRKQELNNRFGHYQHEYFLRLYLPKFQTQDS